MKFGGGALMLSPGEVGSGPPIAGDVQEVLIDGGTQTTEPISLNWKDLLVDEILDIAVSCQKEGWDGYDAAPISSEAVTSAYHLIFSAPDSIRPPEAVPSPDGEIVFEHWHPRLTCPMYRLTANLPYGRLLLTSELTLSLQKT